MMTTTTHTTDDSDPADRRPMSLADIRDSYAECATWFTRLDWLDRRLTGRYRREIFDDAEGHVLDVACGTGTNFEYLPASVDLVGIDISPEMLATARDRLDRLEIDGRLQEMDAQNLAFNDDSFDTVISSLSTCTFPDPVAALEEMDRVCRPDGRILLLEHGRSNVGPIARFQDWRADAHYAHAGCRWNQEPLELLVEAELPIRSIETRALGIITLVEAQPSRESLLDTVRAHVVA